MVQACNVDRVADRKLLDIYMRAKYVLEVLIIKYSVALMVFVNILYFNDYGLLMRVMQCTNYPMYFRFVIIFLKSNYLLSMDNTSSLFLDLDYRFA